VTLDLGLLYEGPPSPDVVRLDDPRDVPPLTPEEMAALGAFTVRQELERSPAYLKLRPRISQLASALAYRPADPAPTATGRPSLRVVSWNMERGTRLDGVKALLATHPEASAADIIMLNEVDRGMARSGNLDTCAELARHLGMHMLFGNGYFCLGYGGPADGPAHLPNHMGMHGNAILSRYPMSRAEVFSVPVSSDRYHTRDQRLGHKKALWAEVQTPAGPLAVASVHLDSITSPARRAWQMRGVLRHLLRRIPHGPLLLGGDLNTSTLDFSALPALSVDLSRKVLRGGVRGIMRRCLQPERHDERPLFEALEGAGLRWRELNPPRIPTFRFEVQELEDACSVMSFPPPALIRACALYLRTLGGVAPFKLDWFAGRDVEPVGSPEVIPRPVHAGHRISDHDPILVDIAL